VGLKEGIARFDRLQIVVGRDPSAISGMGVALSEEVFAVFQAMLLFCVTGEEDEDLQVFRNLLLENYRASKATQAISPPPG
jgi:hypothetical protein